MWFDPKQLSKPKPSLAAGLVTPASFHRGMMAEAPKVAEVAEVASSNESKTGASPPPQCQAAHAAFSDPAAETRRQKLITMLTDNPAIKRAVVSAEGQGAFVVAVAIRGIGTCELVIPKERYDGFRLIELLDRCGTMQ